MLRSPAPLGLFAFVLLAGCAASGEFPSLAPRPIEKGASAVPTSDAPPIPAAADAELARRIAAIVAAAESAHAGFAAELANARAVVTGARGAAAGSERWVTAQQAYSRAETARSPLISAMADLDALRRARINNASPADLAALDGAAARIEALEAAESSDLTKLAALLG